MTKSRFFGSPTSINIYIYVYVYVCIYIYIYIYIYNISLSNPMLFFCKQTHTYTHTWLQLSYLWLKTSGIPIRGGCWTSCCFLLNFTYRREMMNWVSSWVSVTDSSHVQFGWATVCFMTKNWCTASEMWQAVCIWSVIRMLHNISRIIRRTALLQTCRNTK